jgi:hypothetical protein
MKCSVKILKSLVLVVCAWAAALSTASADVQLSMANGRVSIVATEATVRQILTEWARVGQTKIVNVERIGGGPVSLELTNMPEAQALDLLLRSVSGYLASPRPIVVTNASQFDRIIVMPTSATPRQQPAATAAAPPAPMFNAIPQPTQDEDADEDRPPQNMAMPTPNPRGPVFNPFPQPQVVNPQQGQQGQQGVPPGGFVPQQGVPPGGFVPQQMMPPTGGPQTPAAYPGAPTAPPGSVTTPGMIAPMPPQPGQPGQPGVPVPPPGQPVRQRERPSAQ